MLGLIRDMLLIKTAHGDVSAMISPAYTAEQLKRLGEGLAPATLIAYSRILQDAACLLYTSFMMAVISNFSARFHLFVIQIVKRNADQSGKFR